jgi:A/G-specific adenine glycosylase
MAFSQKLEAWYIDYGRTLPWRGIDDPYRIWLSEIILQQTRIEQGRDYYHRFVEAFPTVADLAAASEEQVLRLWQGLGYYSRARNLHASAQYIMEHGGKFPATFEEILKLKGVGRYTAAAIASFAYRLPHPVIDGNVYRFISRLHGISTPIGTDAAYREFESLLLKLIDRERPDRFNAALMDFGSLQCKPQPDCTVCPFADECVAFRTGRVDLFPVKAPKTKPTDRWFLYFDLRWHQGNETYGLMQRRDNRDIWRGLFEFALLETDHRPDDSELRSVVDSFLLDRFGCRDVSYTVGDELVHQLTHRTIHARFISIELPQEPGTYPPEMTALPVEKLEKMPVPRLIDKYLRGL